jgi:ABC-type multidrug transport system fused ATPase/permease subunit
VIKAYGAEAREQARFEVRSREAFAAALRARSFFAALGVLCFWLIATAILVATGIAALRTQQGAALSAQRLLLAGGFSAWNLGLFSFSKASFGVSTQAIERLLVLWARAQDIAVGLDRVFELLDVEPEVSDAPDAVPLTPPRSGIHFRAVGFAYQPGRPVLEDISFEAPCGALTALLGPTGRARAPCWRCCCGFSIPTRVASRSTASICAGCGSRACARTSRLPCRRTCSSARRSATTSGLRSRTPATPR